MIGGWGGEGRGGEGHLGDEGTQPGSIHPFVMVHYIIPYARTREF